MGHIIKTEAYPKVKDRFPKLIPLYVFEIGKDNGMLYSKSDLFNSESPILAAKPPTVETYKEKYPKYKILGYVSPQKDYAGATIPIYEIAITFVIKTKTSKNYNDQMALRKLETKSKNPKEKIRKFFKNRVFDVF